MEDNTNITNTEDVTTQVTDTQANEENGNTTEQQVNTQENTDGQVEEGNIKNEEDNTSSTENDKKPTVEELQKRIEQYELKEQEDRMLKEQLGLGDVDSQTYNYMNIDQQIVNEGKQVYLRLCNEYGVDANPANIDKSVEELKQTDPAKAYEFQRKFENLSNDISSRRQVVQQQNAVYEVSKFANDYSQLLQAAPALENIVEQYVENYGGTGDMYNQLKGVMEVILPAYQEAFNAGRQYAMQDKAARDTSGVNGGVATANTQTYSSGTTFTREQIARMSYDEFAKNEKEIQRQMIEGKIK